MEMTEKKGNPVRIPYHVRWGRMRSKARNGSWKKDLRRERALERAKIPTPLERTKKYRLGLA